MRVLVTGASGLVGAALVDALTKEGREVWSLVRRTPQAGAREIQWNPLKGVEDLNSLEGAGAVVHLAGENIAEGRWTDEKKARIRESRVRGTRVLSEALASLSNPPKSLLCASAIGFYGDRGAEVLTEESEPGTGFLPDVCREWEAAAEPARERGIRVVYLRFGVIFSASGGALEKMLTPFKMGVGGKIGSGEQYMSWITLDDAIGVVKHALTDETLSGPVNVVTPGPVTNLQFTRTMGRVLSRPAIFSVPAFAARLAFGEMADAALLASERVEPSRLKQSGYVFQYPELEGALRHVLKK
jgi:uncharacterized protein (TIGR01777 family)